jgi:hypothetical protein
MLTRRTAGQPPYRDNRTYLSLRHGCATVAVLVIICQLRTVSLAVGSINSDLYTAIRGQLEGRCLLESHHTEELGGFWPGPVSSSVLVTYGTKRKCLYVDFLQGVELDPSPKVGSCRTFEHRDHCSWNVLKVGRLFIVQ